MPQNIEEAFKSAGVPLFPRSAKDISADCSCPDFANPCKHIAAVYYLLGEQFDSDPFLLFVLRGKTKEQIIESLRARRVEAAEDGEDELAASVAESAPPLADLLATFYQAGDDLHQIAPHIAAPEIKSPLLKRLGTAPANTQADLQLIYEAMTKLALSKVFGEFITSTSRR